MTLQLLFKDDRLERVNTVQVPRLDEDDPFSRIRCPLCGWRPSASSVWTCIVRGTPEPFFAACGTEWNTFATHGVCPGCSHRWQWTSCHRCEGWSLHDDWYEPRDGPPPS